MLYLTQPSGDPAAATASVTLPIDVRVKSRVKVTQRWPGSRPAAPCGLLLRGGDVLSNEEGTEFVQVIAADEGVSVVRCGRSVYAGEGLLPPRQPSRAAADHAGRVALHHRDHVLDDMLRQFGLTVTLGQLPFEPEAGAYASESHGHHHAHHDHHAPQLH